MSYKSYVVYKAIVGWSPTTYVCVFFLYISLSLSLCQSLSNQ